MRRFISIWILGAILAGAGCGGSGKVMGKAPKGPLKTVLAIRAGDTGQNVVLSGTMDEKCPVAGCWFWLNDTTGMIRVDTKTAGFVVTGVPLHRQVTVAGRLVEEDGETVVHATGMRY